MLGTCMTKRVSASFSHFVDGYDCTPLIHFCIDIYYFHGPYSDQYSTRKLGINFPKVFAFEMRFLLFILAICFSLPLHFSAAPLNASKGNERTTNEGYVFNNVYNSGLSTSQAQEILKLLKAVEQKMNEIVRKAPSKGKIRL